MSNVIVNALVLFVLHCTLLLFAIRGFVVFTAMLICGDTFDEKLSHYYELTSDRSVAETPAFFNTKSCSSVLAVQKQHTESTFVCSRWEIRQIRCSQVISPSCVLVHPKYENCCVSKSQSDFYYQLLTTVRMDFEYSQILANGRCPVSTFFQDGVWMSLKYLRILATSWWCDWEQKIIGTKNRFEELDDCDRPMPGCYVAFTVAEHTWYSQFDWLMTDWVSE